MPFYMLLSVIVGVICLACALIGVFIALQQTTYEEVSRLGFLFVGAFAGVFILVTMDATINPSWVLLRMISN